MRHQARLLRRIVLTILMPVALLLPQQGAAMHELEHAVAAAAASSGAQASAPEAVGLCLGCLAFAQVAGVARPDHVAPALAAGLRHGLVATASVAVVDMDAPAPRSRGPPSFL